MNAGNAAYPNAESEIANILVAVDFSKFTAAALDYATFLAEAFGATLTLVTVMEPRIYPEDVIMGLSVDEIDRLWIESEEKNLHALCQTIKWGIPSTTVVEKGTPWSQIIASAKSWNADLVVLGTHGRTGLKHAVMGSTAERVVRHATCPVLVVPSQAK